MELKKTEKAKIFAEVVVEIFVKFDKTVNQQIKEAQWPPSRINIMIKLKKCKEKNIKIAKKEQHYQHRNQYNKYFSIKTFISLDNWATFWYAKQNEQVNLEIYSNKNVLKIK